MIKRFDQPKSHVHSGGNPKDYPHGLVRIENREDNLSTCHMASIIPS